MLLLFFGGILLVDGVLAPFNFMVFKYFDPDYYAYRRLCLIYPAQIVHDKPLYKLYRHEQRLHKQAQKQLQHMLRTIARGLQVRVS